VKTHIDAQCLLVCGWVCCWINAAVVPGANMGIGGGSHREDGLMREEEDVFGIVVGFVLAVNLQHRILASERPSKKHDATSVAVAAASSESGCR
jgi:hypothetical protein